MTAEITFMANSLEEHVADEGVDLDDVAYTISGLFARLSVNHPVGVNV